MSQPSIERLLARYAARKKGPAKQTTAPTPVAFLNLCRFYMALDAFTQALAENETLTAPSDIQAIGNRLAVNPRYLAPMIQGVDKRIAPLASEIRASAVLRTMVRGQRHVRALNIGSGLRKVFPRAKRKANAFSKMVGAKQEEEARRLTRAVASAEHLTTLNAIAALPAGRGFTPLRQWILQAAKALGVEPTEAEQIMASASTAKQIGTQLREVEAAIEETPGDSPKSVALQEERLDLLDDLTEVADESPNPTVVMATAATEKTKNDGFRQSTETGRKLGLSPQQEQAMVADGRKVIAAGAGSGKTRVLAGEVAYRINEKGYAPHEICAVSFTRKSSAELISRVQEYGAVIGGAGRDGFGTTHYVAGVTILGKYGKGYKHPAGYLSKKEQWVTTTLTAIAVKQVSMTGGRGECPQPRNVFTGDESEIPQKTLDTPKPNFSEKDPETEAFIADLEDAKDYWSGRWGDYPQKVLNFLDDLTSRLQTGAMAGPSDLTPGQAGWLRKILSGAGVSYKFASEDDVPNLPNEGDEEPTIERKGNTKYVYWKQPAGEWFNLGFTWKGKGDKTGQEGQQFSAAGVKRKIEIWKGMGASPEEVWYAAGVMDGQVQPYTPEAAAYAAYEWLKGAKGEPDFRNKGDMNDLLIDAARCLAKNGRARNALQKRFKVILVDEAQDLNRTQHVLFGLLSGSLDPQTLQGTDEMTADTFGFIGDDKQAIYEFRGAEPEEFIDKSDQMAGGDFGTYVLETNYRSGQAIVDAANKLIRHNEKQIAMTCRANYEVKGDGAIMGQTFADQEDAADFVAETILDSAEAAATTKAKWSNFGIATRSNAEAVHYALAMIKKAIPFKCKTNPFKGQPVKAMLGWMALVEGGFDMPKKAFVAAVSDALLMPKSYLGKAFTKKLAEQRSPFDWISTREYEYEFNKSYVRNIDAFRVNLSLAHRLSGQSDLTASEIYSQLQSGLKSADGKSYFDAIVDNIKDDNDKMAELAAEAEDGIPTDEQIEAAAEEELILLTGLMESKEQVGEVMDYVRNLKRVNERMAKDEDDDTDAVTIGTMHSWKGLEVPNLFLPLVRGKFPRGNIHKDENGNLVCDPPDKNDPALASERRLAYVAITRAENQCYMMDIPRENLPCPPSQFFSEACVPMNGYDPNEDEEEQGHRTASWDDAMIAEALRLEQADSLAGAWGELD